MALKQLLKSITPSFVKERYHARMEKQQLDAAQRAACKTDKLRSKHAISLSEIFTSHELEALWLQSEKELIQFDIPDGTGGASPADRRAIYYLISALKPQSVLEVGTHIGASTIYIASALRSTPENNPNLTTVDIRDVNSQIDKPWLKFGAHHSPIDMLDKLGYRSLVNFITDTSLNFALNCHRTFDFIFLDGDHSSATVYQEIPVALNLLNQNGIILIHDYFPGMQPLSSNDGLVISGPFLAVEKLRREGLNLSVLPLGKLPWPTGLESHLTSLALLLRDG
jgi:predicted O-methyltransferase YrrM